MKVLLWIILISAVIWTLRTKKSSLQKNRPDEIDRTSRHKTEPMLRCEHCEIYIPASEAVVNVSRNVFCSEEHRLRHSSR